VTTDLLEWWEVKESNPRPKGRPGFRGRLRGKHLIEDRNLSCGPTKMLLGSANGTATYRESTFSNQSSEAQAYKVPSRAAGVALAPGLTELHSSLQNRL
jgi:hypothetical protein